MQTALVTALGSAAGDIVIEKLKALDIRVIGCSIHPREWLADALAVDEYYQCPRADSADYLPFLYSLCEKEQVNFILPLIDPEVDVLNDNRAWFEEHDVTLCICPKTALDTIRDKKRLADFIAERCPDTKSIPTEYLRDLPEMPDWGFPLVCKPCNGRSSQGLVYVNNQAEWDALVATADKDVYIVEPFVEGVICMMEIVRDPVSDKVVATVREELLATPHGLSLTVRSYSDPEVEEPAKHLATELGIKGNVNFEYLRDPQGAYHFVECNPRFSAGAKFTVLSGYDVVTNHIRVFSGQPIDDFEFGSPRVIARKYEEYVTKVELD